MVFGDYSIFIFKKVCYPLCDSKEFPEVNDETTDIVLKFQGE